MTIGTYSAKFSINTQLVLRDWFHRKERELFLAEGRLDRLTHKARWAPLDTPMEEWIIMFQERDEALGKVYQLRNELDSLYDILKDSGYRCRMYVGWGKHRPKSEEEHREGLRKWIKKRSTPGWDPFGDEY